jgi:hypothetical protein
MSEKGPIYGIELLKSLPLDGGTMKQALPNRHDLVQTRSYHDRVSAGFEVLTEHYRRAMAENERLRVENTALNSQFRNMGIAPYLDRMREQAEEIERLTAIVDRLQPYEQMAIADERRRERQAQREAEIAAGLRCGGGIIGCSGGLHCKFDHK